MSERARDAFPFTHEELALGGRAVPVDGVEVHVVEEGRGRPLLLLHGFPFTHEAFRHIRADLAAKNRVLAVDLPGFGGSERPPAFAYDFVAYADLMATLVRQLDAAPCTVLAHGFSAAVAAAMAVLAPGSIDRLVLVSPVVSARPTSWLDGLAMRDGLVGEWLFRRTFTRERLARQLREQWRGDPAAGDADWLDRVWRPMARPGGLDAARRVLLGMASLDPAAELPARLTCPTLVVAGEGDLLIPPARTQALADEIRGARFAMVAGCGHCPHEERPAEFRRAIETFFEERAD